MGQTPDNASVNVERINNEARAWFIEIHYGDNGPDVRTKFKNWLAEHQQHQKIYDDVCAFMQGTEVYTGDPLLKVRYKDLLPEGTAENIVAFKQPAQKTNPPVQKKSGFGRRFFLSSMAASLLFLLAVPLVFQNFFTENIYQTIVGEQRTVILADGSTVKLNTNTKISIDFTDESRSVVLDHGQAYFIVAKDKARPFTVKFDMGTVTALGTEFEVYNKGSEVIVSLVEGTVKVHGHLQKAIVKETPGTPPELEDVVMVADYNANAGKQISLSAEHISSIIKTDNKLINAWQEKQMIFRDKTLEYIISEINRYSPRKIILGQPDLANEVISGVFPIQSGEALEIISKYFGFTETVNSRNEIVLARAA
ncbi:MAG: FecR domain-containing protein [Emcibacter sp.]|nr:FecR domain-containing protein [Emcibacter sp.]